MLDLMLDHIDRSLVIVDVGCRWGFAEPWLQLGERVQLIGFEPDEQECDRLREHYSPRPNIQVVQAALGASVGQQRLYLTAQPACSSLYPPDDSVRQARPALDPDIRLVGDIVVEVTTLDRWMRDEGVQLVDFMKIDTQGSELDVMGGSREALTDVRALEVEVEFNPIYRGQPLFCDVDEFLRDHDFVLWRFRNLSHYGLVEVRSDIAMPETSFFDNRPVPVEAQGGQLYWADAVYVKKDLSAGLRIRRGPLPCETGCSPTSWASETSPTPASSGCLKNYRPSFGQAFQSTSGVGRATSNDLHHRAKAGRVH